VGVAIGAQGERECIESSVKRVGESRGDGDGDTRLRRWDSQRGGKAREIGNLPEWMRDGEREFDFNR
jgi:hypothetical protein